MAFVLFDQTSRIIEEAISKGITINQAGGLTDAAITDIQDEALSEIRRSGGSEADALRAKGEINRALFAVRGFEGLKARVLFDGVIRTLRAGRGPAPFVTLVAVIVGLFFVGRRIVGALR